MIPLVPLLSAGASLLGGVLSGNSAKKAADMQAQAAAQAAAQQQRGYDTAKGYIDPTYLQGGAAANQLAAQYGLQGQNYEAAAFDPYQAFLDTDAGKALARDYATNAKAKKFYPTIQAYIDQHMSVHGLSLPSAPSASANPTQANGGLVNGLDPLQSFMATPGAKIAQNDFLNFDTPEINAAYSTGGKTLSGAQKLALSDAGARRLSGAYGNFVNGLSEFAQQGVTAGSNLANLATGNASNQAQATAAAGDARASGYTAQQEGLKNGVSGAISSILGSGVLKNGLSIKGWTGGDSIGTPAEQIKRGTWGMS